MPAGFGKLDQNWRGLEGILGCQDLPAFTGKIGLRIMRHHPHFDSI